MLQYGHYIFENTFSSTMKLWTIQTEEAYKKLLEEGHLYGDFSKSIMQDWKLQYEWLAARMRKRIDPPSPNISFPIWAWHTYDGKRKKPDLRRERFGNGFYGEVFYCLEIEIPDNEVLLSDFDLWNIILLNGLISYSEKEDEKIEAQYESLQKEEKESFLSKNWEKVFDIIELDNPWVTCGEWIQATFWELKTEHIKQVWKFISASRLKGQN